jgi:hypothetical protein
MAVRQSLFDDPTVSTQPVWDGGGVSWLDPGGSPTVPATAVPTTADGIRTARNNPAVQQDFAPPPAGPGSSTLPASFGGPLPPGQTPPPSVNPQVVYTDPTTGQGYNPNELQQRWNTDAAFRNNPLNARVADILQQYGMVLGTSMAATPSVGSGDGSGSGSGGAYTSQFSSGLSQQLDAALSNLLANNGATPDMQAMMARLNSIIANGGDVDPMIAERSLNMARDAESQGMTAQTNDLRAQLASRGRASTPGVTQGGEVDALTRLTEAIAPIYSGQIAGIENTAAANKQASLQNALSMATGLSQSEASNMLGLIGTGTNRQSALAGIALQQLQTDQQWNEFMASYGLQKDQVTAQIQSGNITALIPYLELFLQQAQQGAQGFIGG